MAQAVLTLLQEISSRTVETVEQLWHSHSLELSSDSFWDYMQDMYPDLIEPAIEMAAEVGVEYYDSFAEPFATPAPLPETEALRASARWAMSQGDQYTGLELLSGSSVRRVYDGMRDTVILSADAEEGARWARRPRKEACPFCRMLAIRGDVYKSAETALGTSDNPFHDNCHCLAVPVRPGQDYNPPSYIEGWEKEYKAARGAAGSGDPKAILRAWEKLI